LGDGRLLAGQRLQAGGAGRQFRFFNQHAGNTFLDGEFEPAALTAQPVRFLIQMGRMAWVQGTAENIDKLFTNHARTARIEDGCHHCRMQAL
jgi:hypothetical protein